MTQANYDYCLTRVLKDEGGYSNNPSDPGGPTNYGITIADYRKYINSKGVPLDVKNMSIADAKKIYRARYWDSQHCDELASGVDYAVFDYGVNSGIGRSMKVYNKLSAKNKGSQVDLINAICDERLAFLKSLKTWPTFGKGWGRRVAGVRRDAIALNTQKKSTPVPGVVAGITAVAATTVASTPSFMAGHYMWPIVAIVVLGVVVGLVIHWYNKGKSNV